LKELVTVYNDELRCGTWLLSQGFGREHTEILKLCRKYENEMMEFENNKIKEFIVHIIHRETAGQPIQEYLLNYNQVMFLSSLLRNVDNTIEIRKQLIKAVSIAEAIELLKNIDTDDIPVRYVYAMQDDQDRIKIGISNNPERRVAEIQAANGGNITLIMVKQTEKKRYIKETELHNLCNKYVIHSEWFTEKAIPLLQEAGL